MNESGILHDFELSGMLYVFAEHFEYQPGRAMNAKFFVHPAEVGVDRVDRDAEFNSDTRLRLRMKRRSHDLELPIC